MIFGQGTNKIIRQSVLLISFLISFKGIAIISAKSIPCSKPHKTPAVLKNTIYRILWQSFFSGEVLKTKIRGRYRTSCTIEYSGENNKPKPDKICSSFLHARIKDNILYLFNMFQQYIIGQLYTYYFSQKNALRF